MRQKQTLNGKCVLITGAAGGIGSALARQLLFEHGARVLMVDKDFARLETLKAAWDRSLAEERTRIIHADLAAKASIDELYDAISTENIDVLVNNAGIAYSGKFAGMELTDFERLINVNLYAAVRLTHMLLPKLVQRRGFIVNVSSAAGLLAPGGINAYATSKFALVGFSESLRAELKGDVGVSVVCPCFVRTPIATNTLLPSGVDGDQRKAQYDQIDRLVQSNGMAPERVCNAIIRSILKNRGLVVVGLRARFLLGLKKRSPRLADCLNHLVFREFVRRGCVR